MASRILYLALLFAAACGSDETTGVFEPVYYAVAYGTVEQGGEPVPGIEIGGEVYLGACPPAGAEISNTATRSGTAGRYRLLLASSDSAAGQCLRLIVAGAEPVFQTLVDTPFGVTTAAEVRDSVRIDLLVP